MKADAHPLKALFGKDARYLVPLYQRPYVWTRDEKWEPLWEDIRILLRQLENPQSQQTGSQIVPHFLGAIVLDHQFVSTGDLEVRYIIDGQQRLTTLQLFLAAATRIADNHGCDQPARILRDLTANNPDLFSELDHEFKVWPTNTDRDPFRAAMRNDSLDQFGDSRVMHAYEYFLEAIQAWAVELGELRDDGFLSLARAMRDHMRIVVIDLEALGNAQVIFETLNACTTPLLAIDLVKNLVFRHAEAQGADLEALYTQNWKDFDDETWRREVRQGRLNRPRAELFLMHWLAMKRTEETPAHHLYPAFRRLVELPEAPPIVETIKEFASDSEVYASLRCRHRDHESDSSSIVLRHST